MKKLSRIAIALVSLSLITAYFVPVWFIDLEAPQYPEGLGFQIWLSKMSGDLNTINGLNHYIGMKNIIPDSIPELKLMPFLLAFLIGSGLLAAAANKKRLYFFWVAAFLLLGISGGIDFYLWGYDYGHDLDPHAAIKVPGMSYQPPLLGSKQLLNFTAHSYPDTGGWIIIIAGILSLLTVCYELFSVRISQVQYTYRAAAACGIVLVIFSSCNPESKPIEYGLDACTQCRMTITDNRYGCEMVTTKGKVYTFDSAECLSAFTQSEIVKADNIHLMLVTNYLSPGKFMDAESAFFLHSMNLPSPMGAGITAFAAPGDADSMQKKYEGTIIQWHEIKQVIALQ